MDSSMDNENNEQIYESIASCAPNPGSSTSHNFFESNYTVNKQNECNVMKQSTTCVGIPLSVSTASAKRAIKTGAEKIVDTVNCVRTKFGTLSQKLRRSTRRRAPLINSPETPVGKCRSVLGRTPTKLYSPFSIDTPRGKENVPARRSLNRESFKKVTPPRHGFCVRRKIDNMSQLRTSPRLNHELLDAQFGIYELHHTAERIVRGMKN